jgi:hypothetical protein
VENTNADIIRTRLRRRDALNVDAPSADKYSSAMI